MGRELKSLNRSELIDIIYQLKKSEQELQKENEKLKQMLEAKRINLAEVGSIAEASLSLTNIFAVAQESADLYLAEIESRRDMVEKDYKLLIAEANKKAEEIIRKATEKREAIFAEVQKAYTLLKRYEAAVEAKKVELQLYKNQEQ